MTDVETKAADEGETPELEVPGNWEFIDRIPSPDEVEALLKTLPAWWGLRPEDFSDYVQGLPADKKVKIKDAKGRDISSYRSVVTLYFSVAGRQQMLRSAQEMHGWRVDFNPEPVTRTGVPGFIDLGEDTGRIVYREHVEIWAPLSSDAPLGEEREPGTLWAPAEQYHLLGRRPGMAWVPHSGGSQAKGSNPYEKCLRPGTLVLTADLRWVPIGTLEVHDQLIGFDESPVGSGSGAGQKLRRSHVQSVRRLRRRCVRITVDSGAQVTCSTDHQWLVKERHRGQRVWKTAVDMRPGDRVLFYVEPWQIDESREAAWLAGVLDGTGHIGNGLLRWTDSNETLVAEVLRVAEKVGIPMGGRQWPPSRGASRPIHRGYTVGGQAYAARALGMLRPVRLMERSADTWEGQRTWGKGKPNHVTVTLVEDAGEQEVVAVQTSTRTFIAEGMLSHNCETAARGRALAAWGFGVLPGSGVASLEEMLGARQNAAAISAEKEPQDTTPKQTVQDLAEELMQILEEGRQLSNRTQAQGFETVAKWFWQSGGVDVVVARDETGAITEVDLMRAKHGTLMLAKNEFRRRLNELRAELKGV